MLNAKYLGAVLLMSASLAYANNPLPTSYLGLDYLTMGPGFDNAAAGCFSAGCGGEFSGTIETVTGTTANAPGVLANFWCVDSQEDFSWGNAGYADVVQLSAYNSYSQYVRYSNVTDSGSAPNWTDTSLPSSPLARYEMAAYLVSQYPGVAGNLGDPQTVGGGGSDAIQEAIWEIMDNGTYGNPYVAADDPNNASAASAYVSDALANYSSFAATNDSNWAVVSWNADAPGGALNSTNHQTFLVDLATNGPPNPNPTYTGLSPSPEPGFYGALAAGLSGLAFAVRRRRKA